MSEEIKQGDRRKLGFIGIGVMGEPMAANLLRAGFELTIFDRTRRRCEKLVPLGANIADFTRAKSRRRAKSSSPWCLIPPWLNRCCSGKTAWPVV